MSNKLFGLGGVIGFLVFALGFITLLNINPQVLVEIDNLAFSFYNLYGMDGQSLAQFAIYIIPGLLTALLATGLLLSNRKSTECVIGFSFVIASALNWLSFGLTARNAEDLEGDGGLVLFRTIFFLFTSIVGLLLVGTSKLNMARHKEARLTTLIIGAIITILSLLSSFVFNDETWWRTNLSIVLFFLWSGLIGFYVIPTEKIANTRL